MVKFEDKYTGVLIEGNLQDILKDLSTIEDKNNEKISLFSRAAQKSFAETAKKTPMQQNDKNKDDLEIK